MLFRGGSCPVQHGQMFACWPDFTHSPHSNTPLLERGNKMGRVHGLGPPAPLSPLRPLTASPFLAAAYAAGVAVTAVPGACQQQPCSGDHRTLAGPFQRRLPHICNLRRARCVPECRTSGLLVDQPEAWCSLKNMARAKPRSL